MEILQNGGINSYYVGSKSNRRLVRKEYPNDYTGTK